jgi:hypothetical protein
VRLLAKQPGSGSRNLAISDCEIAIKSGIPLDRLRQLVRMTDWLAWTVEEVLNFTIACNFDPTSAVDRERIQKYTYVCRTRKIPPFNYLRKSPLFEAEFLPLMKICQQRMTSLSASDRAKLARPRLSA